jgi:hypothetical protein
MAAFGTATKIVGAQRSPQAISHIGTINLRRMFTGMLAS